MTCFRFKPILAAAGIALCTFTTSVAAQEAVPIVAVGAVTDTLSGRAAVRLDPEGPMRGRTSMIEGLSFEQGVIELELAGSPTPDADPSSRGFVGLAFAYHDEREYEAVYLRPTNGRSEDQVRRNHAVQYVSHPAWPWQRLRAERTSAFEAYADMVPGEWIHVRIEVDADRVRLFVGHATQPTLTVPRLRNETPARQVALWVGAGSVGWFRNLTVRRQ